MRSTAINRLLLTPEPPVAVSLPVLAMQLHGNVRRMDVHPSQPQPLAAIQRAALVRTLGMDSYCWK